MRPHFDLGGVYHDNVIIRNLFSHEREEVRDWDTIVLAYGRIPHTELYEEVKGLLAVSKNIDINRHTLNLVL